MFFFDIQFLPLFKKNYIEFVNLLSQKITGRLSKYYILYNQLFLSIKSMIIRPNKLAKFVSVTLGGRKNSHAVRQISISFIFLNVSSIPHEYSNIPRTVHFHPETLTYIA